MRVKPKKKSRFYIRHKLIFIFAITFSTLIFGIVIWKIIDNPTSYIHYTKATGNLVQTLPWRMAGANIAGNRIDINYNALAIVKKDGTPGCDNPPVNYGFSLRTRGAFIVTATVETHNSPVSMALYGALPIIGDEYRAEQGSLMLTLNGDHSSAQVSEQPDGNAASVANFSFRPQAKDIVQISIKNNTIDVTINNQQVASLPDKKIFNGNLWFGFSELSSTGSATITSLLVKGQNGGLVLTTNPLAVTIKPDKNGLSGLAERKRSGFIYGTAVATNPLVSDELYRQLLSNFNSFTTENALKFQTVHPLPGNKAEDYNFTEADTIVDIAQHSGIALHGHALVFGEANPEWLQNLAATSPEQLQPTMIDHITTLVTRYKGKIANWDVVNEPLDSQSNGLRNDIWYKAIGPDYIAIALTTAHKADPNAGLWINEFGMESDDDRFAAMIAIAQRLKAQNIPLTGIGFQSHIDDGDTIDNDKHINVTKLKSRFEALAKLGLKTRISELDISNDSEYAVFADATKACLESTNCTGVTTWGPTDKYGALDITINGITSTNIGLLWDDNGQPTEGLLLLRAYLANGKQ